MIYDLSKQNDILIFFNQCQWLIENKKHVELKEHKSTRSNRQNAARWLYLDNVATILNERGETFTPLGMKIEVPFTKDNLYIMYWQTLRSHMYLGKTKQLNTKEFTDLVDMVQMMFAKVFNITIQFPSYESLLDYNE